MAFELVLLSDCFAVFSRLSSLSNFRQEMAPTPHCAIDNILRAFNNTTCTAGSYPSAIATLTVAGPRGDRNLL